MVRATEHLESEEVQLLQEGEIVEQVAPAFKLKNGIVRIQIRHPSSPQFPNPIGWVTQDATAAGGPKFLEPGPEPMAKGWGSKGEGGGAKGWDEGKGWPPAKGKGKGGKCKAKDFDLVAPVLPAAGPAAPQGKFGTFQNLIWKPGGAELAPAMTA